MGLQVRLGFQTTRSLLRSRSVVGCPLSAATRGFQDP
jgi:hypothetical protein